MIGDLTKRANDCGRFRQFPLPPVASCRRSDFTELPLETPLSLEVGNEGIIGRRVSLCSRQSSGPDLVVAEGIVGFNYLAATNA